MASVAPNDLSSLWMPFTDNRYFKANPRLMVAAQDMHYTTADGRRVLDGTAGLWCVNAGHGREPIVKAIQQQAAVLDYAPTFQLGHPLAFQLASRVAGIMPEGLDRIFFTNSGSESVDTALKIALAYWRAKGQGQRIRLIGRERGYHGTGFGGISVGGIVTNRRTFGTGLPGTDHLPHTHDPARNAFSKGQPAHGADFADRLEAMIALHGPDTIAAVIVEPVAGSTAVPMGAVAAARHVYDAIVDAPGDVPGIELFHGYTYSSHALACAAGIATIDLYANEGLFARARALESHWEAAMHSLAGLPHVIDIRNFGLIGAIELASIPGQPGSRGQQIFRSLFDTGLLIRVTGDIIALSPPLIISEAQIDQIADRLATGLRQLADA